MARDTPDAADLADLVLAFEADETIPGATLLERDAALGRALDATLDDRVVPRVLAWLDHRREADASSSREALQLAGAGIGALGALFGALAAAGALAFDGVSGRINVVWVLGLFVGLQAVAIAVTALAFLPASARAVLPGLGGLGLLRRLALGPLALRWVPASARPRIEALLGRGRAARSLLGEVQRWLALAWSQSFAVGFNLGVLAAIAGLVVLTDLAFGWSTTLEVDAKQVHAGLRAIAAPWGWLWPAAVPSVELLEATRWFRVDPTAAAGTDPALFGRFWPFLVAAIACYGLLPRLVLRAVAGWRLRRAVADAIELHPEVPRLLARLDPGPVETRSPEEEPPDARSAGTLRAQRGLPERAVVVDWADALGGGTAAGIGLAGAQTLAAGGGCSLDEDAATIATASAGEDPVLVVVRGWETPVLELRDFLVELRASLERGRAILLLPRGARSEAVERWGHWLAPLGDPWLELVREDGGDE